MHLYERLLGREQLHLLLITDSLWSCITRPGPKTLHVLYSRGLATPFCSLRGRYFKVHCVHGFDMIYIVMLPVPRIHERLQWF